MPRSSLCRTGLRCRRRTNLERSRGDRRTRRPPHAHHPALLARAQRAGRRSSACRRRARRRTPARPAEITAHSRAPTPARVANPEVETGTYLHRTDPTRTVSASVVGHPPHDRRHPNPRLRLRRCRHDPAIRRLAHHAASTPRTRPARTQGADRPPALHSRTRSVHFDSVSVMTASLRYAASFVDDQVVQPCALALALARAGGGDRRRGAKSLGRSRRRRPHSRSLAHRALVVVVVVVLQPSPRVMRARSALLRLSSVVT